MKMTLKDLSVGSVLVWAGPGFKDQPERKARVTSIRPHHFQAGCYPIPARITLAIEGEEHQAVVSMGILKTYWRLTNQG